jgi:hypothetical protein
MVIKKVTIANFNGIIYKKTSENRECCDERAECCDEEGKKIPP